MTDPVQPQLSCSSAAASAGPAPTSLLAYENPDLRKDTRSHGLLITAGILWLLVAAVYIVGAGFHISGLSAGRPAIGRILAMRNSMLTAVISLGLGAMQLFLGIGCFRARRLITTLAPAYALVMCIASLTAMCPFAAQILAYNRSITGNYGQATAAYLLMAGLFGLLAWIHLRNRTVQYLLSRDHRPSHLAGLSTWQLLLSFCAISPFGLSLVPSFPGASFIRLPLTLLAILIVTGMIFSGLLIWMMIRSSHRAAWLATVVYGMFIFRLLLDPDLTAYVTPFNAPALVLLYAMVLSSHWMYHLRQRSLCRWPEVNFPDKSLETTGSQSPPQFPVLTSSIQAINAHDSASQTVPLGTFEPASPLITSPPPLPVARAMPVTPDPVILNYHPHSATVSRINRLPAHPNRILVLCSGIWLTMGLIVGCWAVIPLSQFFSHYETNFARLFHELNQLPNPSHRLLMEGLRILLSALPWLLLLLIIGNTFMGLLAGRRGSARVARAFCGPLLTYCLVAPAYDLFLRYLFRFISYSTYRSTVLVNGTTAGQSFLYDVWPVMFLLCCGLLCHYRWDLSPTLRQRDPFPSRLDAMPMIRLHALAWLILLLIHGLIISAIRPDDPLSDLHPLLLPLLVAHGLNVASILLIWRNNSAGWQVGVGASATWIVYGIARGIEQTKFNILFFELVPTILLAGITLILLIRHRRKMADPPVPTAHLVAGSNTV